LSKSPCQKIQKQNIKPNRSSITPNHPLNENPHAPERTKEATKGKNAQAAAKKGISFEAYICRFNKERNNAKGT
jgi:hypothetical protein